MNKIHEATQEYLKKDIPDFDTGDTLVVSVLVREGNKERVQNFEGVVIGRKAGNSLDATFTVRKISNGIGVERIDGYVRHSRRYWGLRNYWSDNTMNFLTKKIS